MIRHPHVTAIVLAGGRASRMEGRNKATLPLGESTPLSRILEVSAGRFAGCIVVAPDPAPYVGLPVTVAADIIPGCGPLGGIHAGLEALKTEMAFVCGCDMPSLSGDLLDFMVRRARQGRLLVPVHRGRPEPLHALYPRSCFGEVEKALHAGIRMMLEFFERVPVDYLPESEFDGIDGASRSFFNINTPPDLEAARGTP